MHITEIAAAILIGALIMATIEEGVEYWRHSRKN